MKSLTSNGVFTFMTSSVFVLFLLLSACKPDPVVVEPTCPTCPRDKFLGTYSVTKGCTLLGIDTGTPTNITAGAADNGIAIDGDIQATVSGTSFSIVKQTINSVVLSGNGGLSGKTLTMTLTLTQGTSSSSCNLTFEKQ